MKGIIERIQKKFNLDNNWAANTGLQHIAGLGPEMNIYSPIDQSYIGKVRYADKSTYEATVQIAQNAKHIWAQIPAPKRGEVIRKIGLKFREHKEDLATLITLEMGKTITEARGEVQEVIDICDYAVGLSRQLYGLSMHSERAQHRMYEQYHPLGIIGIITAFNFPVAVWSWNAIIGAVCGNVCIWKPSELSPLTALATQNILKEVLTEENLPDGIFNVVLGDGTIGELLSKDTNIPLISATGSTEMGKKVAIATAGRLGKSLLELGGNNAIIITPSANLDLALHATLFGVVGTCGQRCTSTRRLIVHEAVYETFKTKLISNFSKVSIGNPLEDKHITGPLINIKAVNKYIDTINICKNETQNIIFGGKVLNQVGQLYVEPTIIEIVNESEIIKHETFAPIVFLIKYKGDLKNAILIQNNVPQGLSSSIFTTDIHDSEEFLSAMGSDCGIANVNIGTSGAEIGGAFGGEKDTGGGRESGSDSWKTYMRRQTNTINFSNKIALAQGVKFEIN